MKLQNNCKIYIFYYVKINIKSYYKLERPNIFTIDKIIMTFAKNKILHNKNV